MGNLEVERIDCGIWGGRMKREKWVFKKEEKPLGLEVLGTQLVFISKTLVSTIKEVGVLYKLFLNIIKKK